MRKLTPEELEKRKTPFWKTCRTDTQVIRTYIEKGIVVEVYEPRYAAGATFGRFLW